MGGAKMGGRWWVGVALAGAMACGGQTEDDPYTRGSDLSPIGGDTGDAATGGNGSACSDCSGFGTPSPLGTCESTGFLQSEAYGRPCNWLLEDTCYDTHEDACECGCPRDQGDVQCVSGFYDGEGSATLVACVPLP